MFDILAAVDTFAKDIKIFWGHRRPHSVVLGLRIFAAWAVKSEVKSFTGSFVTFNPFVH